MRQALERFLRVLWNGEAGPLGALYSTALSPLAGGYGLAMKARNRRHDRRDPTRVPGVRVVSVGNLAVGGTGKTPLAAHLARQGLGLFTACLINIEPDSHHVVGSGRDGRCPANAAAGAGYDTDIIGIEIIVRHL